MSNDYAVALFLTGSVSVFIGYALGSYLSWRAARKDKQRLNAVIIRMIKVLRKHVTADYIYWELIHRNDADIQEFFPGETDTRHRRSMAVPRTFDG